MTDPDTPSDADTPERWCPVHGLHGEWYESSLFEPECAHVGRVDCGEPPIAPDVVAAIEARGAARSPESAGRELHRLRRDRDKQWADALRWVLENIVEFQNLDPYNGEYVSADRIRARLAELEGHTPPSPERPEVTRAVEDAEKLLAELEGRDHG